MKVKLMKKICPQCGHRLYQDEVDVWCGDRWCNYHKKKGE